MRMTNLGKMTKAKFVILINSCSLLIIPISAYGGASIVSTIEAPNIFIIAVGINAYQKQPLQYAKADALAISEAFEKSYKAYPKIKADSITLLDEEAILGTIRAAFMNVIEYSRPDDIFIFHFSGYEAVATDGESKGEYYILPVNVNQGEGSHEILSSKAISVRLINSWIDRIQAKRQLLIFDTCHGENFVAAFKRLFALEDVQVTELSRRRIQILAAEGLALESKEMAHGWLTFTLLKGISGEADAWPRDGVITVKELDIYLRSNAMQMSTAHPEFAGIASATIGGDFDIVRLQDYRGVQVIEQQKKSAKTPEVTKWRDYALVIATDSYDSWPKLVNPINDAKTIENDLNTIYGVETELLPNPTYKQFLDAMERYKEKKYEPSDQLIIFIAGHGTYNNKLSLGYIIVKDSKSEEDDRYGQTFIHLTDLRDIVDDIPVAHLLIIIDSCYGGSFIRNIVGGTKGNDMYAEVSRDEFRMRKMNYKSRFYLTSGGLTYVPDGRPGMHSPFARQILEGLRSYGGKEGYLTFSKIATFVERVTPEPKAGNFGFHQPGGDIVLIPVSRRATIQDTKKK
jgi:uncharacterized caspase-like protein